jgi:hypothetical protein
MNVLRDEAQGECADTCPARGHCREQRLSTHDETSRRKSQDQHAAEKASSAAERHASFDAVHELRFLCQTSRRDILERDRETGNRMQMSLRYPGTLKFRNDTLAGVIVGQHEVQTFHNAHRPEAGDYPEL